MATDFEAISNATYTPTYGGNTVENPDSVLDKDSFMQLLLTELQYQDPTDPMDSDKILSQTSELATLESADNTNKAMEELVAQMQANQDFSSISAIGKMASLGSNAVTLEEGQLTNFEVYFENEIQSGTLNIMDSTGSTVRSVPLDEQSGENGVLAFQWDGISDSGEQLDPGYYYVTADYTDINGEAQQTQFGIYPVESVRFEEGKAYMKLGSSYVPQDYIVEYF